MKEKISSNIAALCFGVLIIVFAIGFYAFAVWTEPGAEPPLDNVGPPINVGPDPQIKQGPLQVDGFRNIGTTVLDGNVGIGTATPDSKLHVEGGDIRISTAGKGLIFPDGTKKTTAKPVVEVKCGDVWRVLGSLQYEGVGEIWVDGNQYEIREGKVYRNGRMFVYDEVLQSWPAAPCGGAYNISLTNVDNWCKCCAGGRPLAWYERAEDCGEGHFRTDCSIEVYAHLTACVQTISCGWPCTNLRWK